MQATKSHSELLPWLIAIIAAQIMWGAYPVLARYLQTVSNLPSMSILGLGNVVALVVLGSLFWRRLDWRSFRSRLLPLFALIVISRGITNFLAARFTLAIYVQLITLMTPFIVALLSRLVLREQLPRHLGRALAISLFGALLIMSASLGTAAQTPFTPSDLIGMGLAAFSTLVLALYMITVRRSVGSRVPGETLLITQFAALAVVSLTISLLIGEDWSAWGQIGRADWLAFGVLALGVFGGANLAQIGALRHLGAPLVSSALALRLVASLVLAAVILGEWLTSPWQIAGAVIVVVTITWYLWQQR